MLNFGVEGANYRRGIAEALGSCNTIMDRFSLNLVTVNKTEKRNSFCMCGKYDKVT